MFRRKAHLAMSTLPPLQPAERRELLRLARAAIGAALNAVGSPALELSTPALHSVSGVFVSLHLEADLRGCVGTLTPTAPLHVEVMRMACAAAFEDPRFPPLTVEEWYRVAIEISRLSPPRPAYPEELQPGVHGVYISRGTARGLLLPQVAAQLDWNRERLLAAACVKAGLDPDAWRDAGTGLSIFVADIISEHQRREPPPGGH